ncbi:MAG: N-acyl homoserine lactonase family protein [Rhodospirillaceae bacterium]|jgi:N-acyl homoserine lactone hydrolase|nr:N-acyl homoserine lactonase family protein [Rhodospirillaceae bacterium]MBT4588156.1 N-acyl homoserine lactonase family protein [Rhodospirillaceae bacterium]MBT4938429.1 N-acyl homoserine lactonase family protein [Rhodospirillaceae bacterium]MBT5938673.1 N-acyl homoserine lactonase family protein [Rhodospirillaceae bacterium]MBT7265343.1 N-acyl homoserine lactonase family protein [Rhodospirillaceae bacterium]
MKMNILSGGRLQMKRDIFIPSAGPEEIVDLPVMCFLLRHPEGNVLFDTGCHPSAAVDAKTRWGGLAEAIRPTMGKKDNVVDGLGSVGLTAADIDVVVNSHFHMDHCGCNEFFTQATMIVHSAELDRVRDPKLEGKGYFKADWDTGQEFDVINAQRDLFGDDRIVLLPLPGHTPGLTGALINFDNSGSFLLASDSVALKENLNPEIMSKNIWDEDLTLKSITEINKIQSQGTTIIFGHDEGQWKQLKKGAEAYD